MDIFAFPPVAFALSATSWFVQAVTNLLDPVTGSLSAALAIVVLTLLVRLLLIPVSISQVKAEWTRRRLAPKLRALQRKYKSKPEVLQRKVAALYKAENTRPFAGILPTLAQAPVISLVYALFIHGTIGGHANVLLAASLGGVPLGSSFVTVGVTWPGIVVFVGLLSLIALTAWLSRRIALKLALPADDATARVTSALSWLPFITVVFATIVPLAATIYLATTTTFTLVERAILRRRYWGELAL